MSQPDNAASIQACALRLARLAADGTTPAGATNGYVTKNFITLTMSPEVDEGQDFSAPNACGDDAFPVRDRPKTRRWNLSLSLEVPDPEIGELLTASPIILSTPAAARTLAANGSTTTGSPTITSPTMAATGLDLGAGVSGTGIPVGATIIAINSPTSVDLSQNATATASGTVSFTITPVAQTIGLTSGELGKQASDNGVSLEVWTKMFVGQSPASVLPYTKWAFPRTYWRFDTREFANAKMATAFSGYAIENPNWGNGPWNDWVDPAPSSRSLTRAWGYHRVATIPSPAVGYTTVPAQA